ncbi:MAG TPA: hypothetical protein VGX45_17250, partial [Solirubrobacteraceae bacterium]|nr:hypothetical protein [Solirubrobacteraceae bacterium]
MPVVHRFSNQPFGRRLALIAGGALAVRLLYIFVIAPEPIGVGGDASFYHSAANLIAQGHFYERRIFGHAYQTALHPPLYSIVLSVVAWLGGVHLLPQRLVGLVIGTISVYLIGELGRRIAATERIASAERTVGTERTASAEPTVGAERTGLIAAGIAAIYPPFITADGSIMSEPLYVLLLVVALLLALSLIARPTVTRAAALGAVIGLS